jgi:hypothetical protein
MTPLDYLLWNKARIFFPEFNIRLYDKNSIGFFFFLHQIRNIFLEKKPFKLNGRSLNRNIVTYENEKNTPTYFNVKYILTLVLSEKNFWTKQKP